MVDVVIVSNLPLKKGGSGEFQGHMVIKEQSWNWIVQVQRASSKMDPSPLNTLNLHSGPYKRWDPEIMEVLTDARTWKVILDLSNGKD